MGEGELARVLAAVEALTSQVGDISTVVQQQQQGLEEVRRERAREAEEAARESPFSLCLVLVPCVFDMREPYCAGAAEDLRLGSTSRGGLQSYQGVC